MANDLVLYHYWRSSCSWRVRWALHHKNIPYKAVHIDLLKKEQREPSYLKLNPAGTVPCLLTTNKEPMSESLAILEWLEERFPAKPLLPSDPTSRQRVRQLSLAIVAGIQPLQNLKVREYFAKDANKQAEFSRHWIEIGLKDFETALHQLGHAGSFCYGSQVSFADLCLIPQCYNAERQNINLRAYPKIWDIYQRCLKLPACDKASPSKQAEATA